MDRPIKAAVLGLGLMGDVMVRAFSRDPRWQVTLVADPSSERREQALVRAPQAVGFESAEEAIAAVNLDRLDVDLVAIATPPDTHEPLAVAALERGRHVLCEKPMGRCAQEAERMVAAAEARPDLIAIVDHQLRFTRSRVWLRDRIAAGDLGTVRHVEVFASIPRLIDSPWTWWSRRDLGGGLLNEFGSHSVDLLGWLFGPPETACGVLRTTVRSRADAAGRERPVDSDDLASFRVSWADGLFADVQISGLALPADRYLRVHGDAGTIELDVEDSLIWTRRDGTIETLDLHETEPSLIDSPTDAFSQPFARLIGELPAAIASGSPPADATAFAEGLAITRLLDAVRESAGTTTTEVSRQP